MRLFSTVLIINRINTFLIVPLKPLAYTVKALGPTSALLPRLSVASLGRSLTSWFGRVGAFVLPVSKHNKDSSGVRFSEVGPEMSFKAYICV